MADEVADARRELAPRLRKLARKTGCEFEIVVSLTVRGKRTYTNEKGETSIAVGERSAVLDGLRGNKDQLRSMVASLSAELGGADPDFSDDE